MWCFNTKKVKFDEFKSGGPHDIPKFLSWNLQTTLVFD